MKCIAPKEIKEGDLIAYLDGEAHKRIVQHISRCAFCQKEIEGLHQMDTLFKKAIGEQPEGNTPQIIP